MSTKAPNLVKHAQRLAAEARSGATEAAQIAKKSAEAASAAKENAQKFAAKSAEASEYALKYAQIAELLTAPDRGGAERLRRSFQTLWVGGTLGAFFAAVIVSIPDAYRQSGVPASFPATTSLLLRYGYMIWLLAYFFVSNLLNEDHRRRDAGDVWFDVLQSAGAFAVAWLLGFLSPKDGFSTQPIGRAIIWANVVIAGICLLSLSLFHADDSGANRYRWAGLAVTMLTLGVLWPFKLNSDIILIVSSVSFVILACLLVFYIFRRIATLTG